MTPDVAELGETTDPAALLPGDPAGVRAVQATMSRLGSALVGAGDGLRRIDTGEWQGEAADSFRRVFEPVPPQWIGTGEAFLQAADALAEYADVLEGARDDAATAVQEWAAEPVAAADRLRAARSEVLAAGDRAATLVGHARDLAPPAPSVAQQLGGFLGDLAGGAWSELSATGQFLWQVNPTRFLVEPAAAVQGWEDLGTGVAHAVTHPAETVAAALNPREAATNPTRWAGEVLTGAGLSALGGAGAAGRIERATRAAGAVPAGAPVGRRRPGPTPRALQRPHRRGARSERGRPDRAPGECEEDEGADPRARHIPGGRRGVPRAGGRRAGRCKLDDRRTVVLLEDGTYMTWRPSVLDAHPTSPRVDINTPRRRVRQGPHTGRRVR